MKKLKFNVSSMTCSACSARVEKVANDILGVDRAYVNLLKNTLTVEVSDNLENIDKIEKNIITSVSKAGYPTEIVKSDLSAKADDNVERVIENVFDKEVASMKQRLVLSIVFSLPLMYISMGHMMGLPLPKIFLGNENLIIWALTQFILTIPVVFVNRKFFSVGFLSLLKKAPNMDSLIAIGSGASLLYSIVSLFQISYYVSRNYMDIAHAYAMNIYFESAAMILTLITLGKYFEVKAKKKTSEAIEKLMDLSPKYALRVIDGVEEEVLATSLKVGDVIIVKAGETVATDGIILEGYGVLDESLITGESLPVDKSSGDRVIGGTINQNGSFFMEVEKVGSDTALWQIIQLVDDATTTKAPIQKLADKISGIFVPIVIVVSIITFFSWIFISQEIEKAFSMAVSVLVISCPCALGLATPTAIMVGVSKGVSSGVLIKTAEALENIHLINRIMLDKTGTITEGKPKITDIVIARGVSKNKFMSLIYSLERLSEHPLAKAVIHYGKEENIDLIEVKNFVQVQSKGVKADVDELNCLIGNLFFMEEEGIKDNLDIGRLWADRFAKEGKTPLFVAIDSVIIGIIALSDSIKESSIEAIKTLQNRGISVTMLTGDNENTAKAIAEKIGITDVFAQVLPEDKESIVKTFIDKGDNVAMVGDGINDAPALARANLGIAIGAGTDIAIESADVVLMKNSLTDVVALLDLSKKVLRAIKQNLFWAYIYNIIGIPIAAGVLSMYGVRMTPMLAAMAMSLSSLGVVLNALRLKFFAGDISSETEKVENERNTIYHNLDDGIYIENKIEYNQIYNTDLKRKNNALEIIKEEDTKEEDKMRRIMDVRGMTCHKCVAHVKMALEGLDGVEKADVNLQSQSAEVTHNGTVTDEDLKNIVENAGYDVMEIK